MAYPIPCLTPNGPGLIIGKSEDKSSYVVQHEISKMTAGHAGIRLTSGSFSGVWVYPYEEVTVTSEKA